MKEEEEEREVRAGAREGRGKVEVEEEEEGEEDKGIEEPPAREKRFREAPSACCHSGSRALSRCSGGR